MICMLIVLIGRYLILEKEKELLHEKYKAINENIKNKADSLISIKKNATFAIAIALAENGKIKEVFLDNEKNKYDLNELSLKIRKYTSYKNIWFQLIDKEGVSLYRSWTDNKNDKIIRSRANLPKIFEKPTIQSVISVGEYDMTFKSIIPIYENKIFMGVLEVITHFNSISNELKKDHFVEPIVIANKKYTNQLREKSFSKNFIKDYYIANLKASNEILEYLKNKNIDKILKHEAYLIKDKRLIINTPILENNENIGNILVFKNLNKIDISEITKFKTNSFLYLMFFFTFSCLTIFIIAYYLYTRRLKELNKVLQETVNKEIIKNDEKNKILFQQNKMAAIGEMIGNIAHQWRQPLSVITVLASSVKVKSELGILNEKDYIESYTTILETANYLSNTIDDFQYYFSPNKSKNSFSSEKLVEKSIKILTHEFKEKDIILVKNIEKIEVFSFENELLQVLINIFNNAKEELIKKEKNYKKYIFIDLYKEKDSLIIEIKDNAGGIDEEIINRVFEPYFTTKHKSKGTGIGLYMCQEIIVKHIKGNIDLSNETYKYDENTYKGALFKLTIPLK